MPPIAGLLYQGAEVSMGALSEEIESEEDVAQVSQSMGALLSKVAIAICSDSLKKPEELRPEDFQIVAVSQVDAEALVLSVEAPVRAGHRLKFVIRERRDIEDDLRDRLLAYKRADLTGMLTVRALLLRPPPLLAAAAPGAPGSRRALNSSAHRPCRRSPRRNTPNNKNAGQAAAAHLWRPHFFGRRPRRRLLRGAAPREPAGARVPARPRGRPVCGRADRAGGPLHAAQRVVDGDRRAARRGPAAAADARGG